MLQSLLLMTVCFTVALGTLYPLAAQLLGARSVSVGGEYFNTLGIPLLLPILAMAGFSPLLRWQGDHWQTLRPPLIAALLASVLMVALVFLGKQPRPWFSLLLLVPTAWLLAASVWDLWRRRRWKRSPRHFSVIVGHLGLAVLVLGTVGSGLWRLEIEKALSVGDSLAIGDLTVQYERFDARKEPDYQAFVAHLTVQRDTETLHHLQPEKRFYTVQQRPTSETSLVTVGVSELYAVIGEVDASGRIGLRLYLTPLVFCLWLGFALVAMAGLMAGFARLRKPL
jgi:cytochrome c-type biogenesis protein CcmF